ncbi:unnamed protein product [Somion occarium]
MPVDGQRLQTISGEEWGFLSNLHPLFSSSIILHRSSSDLSRACLVHLICDIVLFYVIVFSLTQASTGSIDTAYNVMYIPVKRTLSDRHDDNVMLDVFLAFQFIGGIGNIAMLLTAIFSRRVIRHSTWLNFCVTWVIFSISYTLLFFAGQQRSSLQTAYPLCLTQASLIYGAPVLVAYASVSLVAQVALSARALILFKIHKPSPYQTLLLLIVPYILWFSAVIAALVSGVKFPETVSRNFDDGGLYCEITTGIPGRIVAVLVGIALVLAFTLEIMLGVTLRKNWAAFEGHHSKLPMSMIIRVAVFVGVSVLAFSTVFVFLSRQFSVSNVVLSLLPFFSFVTFATQKDLLSVWTFRPHP